MKKLWLIHIPLHCNHPFDLKNKYNYQYYIAVVKANCYGHGLKAIEPMLKAGCNYLAVATLDEALNVRELYPNIPILCLGIVYKKDLQVCLDNNITITINLILY